MPDDLVVHLNRDGPHSIGVEPRQFVTGDPFDIVLRNHGTALHVHLHLDDDLSPQATLGTANHFVEEDAVRRVRVTVDDPLDPVEGRLKLVTGYGSETEYVRIALRDVEPEERHVRVDESLGQPTSREEPEPLLDAGSLPTFALGAIAVLVAVVAAVIVGGPTAGLGLGIVFIGLIVAWALLRS